MLPKSCDIFYMTSFYIQLIIFLSISLINNTVIRILNNLCKVCINVYLRNSYKKGLDPFKP